MRLTLLFICCVLLLNASQAQCSFEKKVLTQYSFDGKYSKIIQLKNDKVAYFTTCYYDPQNPNDQNDINLYLVITQCDSILLEQEFSYGRGADRIIDAIETLDGHILLLTYTEGSGNPVLYNMALMKINSSTGQVMWKNAYPKNVASVGHKVSYNQYHNTFLACGYLQYLNGTRGYLLEVDIAGNVIREKIFNNPLLPDSLNNNLRIYGLYASDVNSYIGIGSYFDSRKRDSTLFVFKTDTNFTVTLMQDVLGGEYNFQQRQPYVDVNAVKNCLAVCISGALRTTVDAKYVLIELNLDGKILAHKELYRSYGQDSNQSNFLVVAAAPDGGYTIAPGYLKLDSNLNITHYRKTKYPLLLNYALQLRSGALTGIGISQEVRNNLAYRYVMLHQSENSGWYTATKEVEKPTEITTLYPNPSQGLVQINNEKIKTVWVYDTFGKNVLQTPVVNQQMNITSLVDGLYVIHLFDEQGNLLGKTKQVIQR
jgi:hypothetical protein